MKRTQFDRRRWLQYVSLGAACTCSSRWTPAIAAVTDAAAKQGRHCVVLWMSGGPSQIDTFDMKPDHANGGSIKQISTSVPGIGFQRAFAKACQAGRFAGNPARYEHQRG